MYKVGYSGDNSQTGPSGAIWKDCPIADIIEDPNIGYYFFDDFLAIPKTPPTTEGNFGIYKAFSSTGGTIVDGAEVGGSWALGSDGDDEGASIHTGATPFKISLSNAKLWFEARVKSSTIADTKHGFFVGLMDSTALTATVPLTAAGAIADVNIVGFHRLEGDGDKLDTIYKADGVTQVTVQTDEVTLVADTYKKVGFVWNTANGKMEFYDDGVLQSTTYTMVSGAGTDFPNDITMGLVFAVLNATGSTPGTAEIDWWRCAQLR